MYFLIGDGPTMEAPVTLFVKSNKKGVPVRFILMFVLVGSLISQFTQAAEIESLTANGEVAFDYNFLSSRSQSIPNTEGAGNEAYRLNKAKLILKKETDQLFFLGRLIYESTDYSDGSNTNTAYFSNLDQLELFYKVTPALHVGFGRFITTMGYESTLRNENSFYNNTIAYQQIVPGNGEGLRLKYSLGDWLTTTLSTYNQFRYGAIGEDDPSTKATELSFAGTLGTFTWFAGYLMGTDNSDAPATGSTDGTASDVWISWKPVESLLLTVTYDSKTWNVDSSGWRWTDSWSALGVYTWGLHNLGLRYEMVRGANEIGYGAADEVGSVTVTDKMKLGENLNFYVEGRFDHANEDVFVDADGESTGDAYMITLGAVAYF